MIRHIHRRHARAALAGLAAFALLLFAGIALAGEHPSGGEHPAEHPGGAPQMSPEEMQKMMALIQPGPPHAQLAKMAGTWKAATRMWEGPGDPITGGGTITYEVVLGGRYMIGRHLGTYRDMPFEGISIDGYDNGKKQYFTMWLDNFGTGVMQLTGQPTAEGRGIDFVGTMFDPMGMTERKVREEVRYESDTKWMMTMYMEGPDGKEMKVMEYTAEKQ